MEYQEIFEQVRDIVAEVLKVDSQEINLDFPLFEAELYDIRKLWGSNGVSPHVSNFRCEDAQYYSYRPITIVRGDALKAELICIQLISEFDLEFTDESFLGFTTVERAVNYISQNINCS